MGAEAKLCVQVVEANGLPMLTNAVEGGRGPKLYLVMRIGTQAAATRLVKASKNPEWRETFVFRVKRTRTGSLASQKRLVIQLYSLESHNAQAEAQMACAVGKGDGRSNADLNVEEGLATSIPMPIRSLGRTVVLLGSSDAAPLPTLRSGDDLPAEFFDIIPKRGRTSGVPLFTLGSLQLK